jgi:hypothetical protein
MYLISVFEKEGIVEASLGGRVSADEICVLAGEISDRFEQMDAEGMSLLLDYSRAKRFDPKAFQALNELKDLALDYGVVQIVSVISDEAERTTHQSSRLQMVLEGRESFVPAGGELSLLQQQPARKFLRLAA